VSLSSANMVVSKGSLENELEELHRAGLKELQEAWRRWTGSVPSHLSADLLRRRLAYEVQSRILGGVTSQAHRRLAQLDAAFQADPRYAPSASHALTPGTVLVRAWRGKTYKVHVLEDGFLYAGRTYESLSEIAGGITGAKWSGPAFFGLQRGKR
jgi:hypothetical protein